MCFAEYIRAFRGQGVDRKDSCTYRVVYVVIYVCDAVGKTYQLSFKSFGFCRSGMVKHTVPDFIGEVQIFQLVGNAKALFVVPESRCAELIQNSFARMTEWCMSEVMPESSRFDEIFIQAHGTSDRACDLRDLKCMRQARAVVIPFRCKKHLHFMHETAEGFRMNDSVTIALKRRSYGAGFNGLQSAAGVFRKKRFGAEIFTLYAVSQLFHAVNSSQKA